MNPFEYIKQRITDIADVNVAINGRDPSWGYSDLMELLANIEEAYNDRYGSSDTISRQAAIEALKHDEEYDEDIPNRADGVRDAIITISSLPSALPNRSYCFASVRFVWTNLKGILLRKWLLKRYVLC